jgi:hypothetical protein
MNPLRHIDRNWFWGALLVLAVCLALYYRLTFPAPRPTELLPEGE